MIIMKILNIFSFLLSIALLAFSSYPNKTPDSLSSQFVITTPQHFAFRRFAGDRWVAFAGSICLYRIQNQENKYFQIFPFFFFVPSFFGIHNYSPDVRYGKLGRRLFEYLLSSLHNLNFNVYVY